MKRQETKDSNAIHIFHLDPGVKQKAIKKTSVGKLVNFFIKY